MPEDKKDTHDRLCTSLKNVFFPVTAERRRLATRQFRERKWNTYEQLEVYAGELERLLYKAYPALGADDRQQQLVDQFTEGMPPAVRRE